MLVVRSFLSSKIFDISLGLCYNTTHKTKEGEIYMYTEERKGNLLKEFLLKLILVIIFVLLLIWLVPWPNMDSYIEALNPLKSQIFNANIQEMKDAAILYYTEERLPQDVG